MIDYFHNRLKAVERELSRQIAAPTFPIYDSYALPDDSMEGQIALGTDGSLLWYVGGIWSNASSNTAIVGNIPQDAVDGQLVIGSDNSLNWRVDGTWWNIPGTPLIFGNPPQDAVQGQIALTNQSPGSAIGTDAGANVGLTATVTKAIPVGSQALVIWGGFATDDDGGIAVTSVTDSKGNTWFHGNPTGIGPLTESIGIGPYTTVGCGAAWGHISAALAPSDTITIVFDPFGATVEESIVMIYVLDPVYSKINYFAGNGMGSPSSSPDLALIFNSGDGAYTPPDADFAGAAKGAIFTIAVGYLGGGWAPVQGRNVMSLDGGNISLYSSIIEDLPDGSGFEPGGEIGSLPCCANFTLFAKNTSIDGTEGLASGKSPIWFKDGSWYGLVPPALATRTLYAALGSVNTTSDLYVVDPVSCAMTSIGPIGFALTGLAMDPTTGILYGITSNNSAANPKSLISIDIGSGHGTLIGPYNAIFGPTSYEAFTDICFTSGGILYAQGQHQSLLTINKSTAASTLVSPQSGVNFGGGISATTDGDDNLFASPLRYFPAGDYLKFVNKSTGVYSNYVFLTSFNYPSNNINALAFDQNNVLYGILTDTGSHYDLVTINLTTGHVTTLGALTAPFPDALAWATR